MYSFQCPHCLIPLRVRDAQLRNRSIECPDCRKTIVIKEQNGEIIGVPAELESTVPVAASSVRSPLSFRVLFACVGLIVGGILYFQFTSGNSDVEESEEVVRPVQNVEPVSVTELGEAGGDNPPKEKSVTNFTVAERMVAVHEVLLQYARENQVFPNGKMRDTDGKPPAVSWIAEMNRDDVSDGALLSANQPWNAPVNDSFVRRRLELFYNPQLKKTVGEDRYPATHFAGVSGVGDDAEKLPKLHPRAGIFSPYRETSIADVRDGTANTIMLVGVMNQLGSWARPGSSTIRAFTQEPYVNGPDGMGTGEVDSMFVLMADGSVRTITKEASPIITRRMAAMADGLPLDLQTPGDPLNMELLAAESSSMPTEKIEEADHPIEPEFAPDSPPFDINEALGAKVRLYELTQAVPVGVILNEFQELAGIPINQSAVQKEVISKEVTFEAEDVTLKQMFEKFSSETGLEFDVKPFEIVFRESTKTQ